MALVPQFRINLLNYVFFRHVVGLLGQGIGPSLTSTYTNTITTLIHSHDSSEIRVFEWSLHCRRPIWNLFNSDSAYCHSVQKLSFPLLLSKNVDLRFSRRWPWRTTSSGMWLSVDIVNVSPSDYDGSSLGDFLYPEDGDDTFLRKAG
jgi:hypothetical protein